MIDKLQLLEIATTNKSSYYANTSYYRIEWTGSVTRLTKLAPELESEAQALEYYTSELNAGNIDNTQFDDFIADGTRIRHWHTTGVYPTVSSIITNVDELKAHGYFEYIDLNTLEPTIGYKVTDHSSITTVTDLIEAYWNLGYCFLVKN